MVAVLLLLLLLVLCCCRYHVAVAVDMVLLLMLILCWYFVFVVVTVACVVLGCFRILPGCNTYHPVFISWVMTWWFTNPDISPMVPFRRVSWDTPLHQPKVPPNHLAQQKIGTPMLVLHIITPPIHEAPNQDSVARRDSRRSTDMDLSGSEVFRQKVMVWILSSIFQHTNWKGRSVDCYLIVIW